MSDKKTIFLLEDDEAFAIIFRRWLEEENYRVVIAKTFEEAKSIAENESPALFWLDYYLEKSHKTGIDFFNWLKTQEKYKITPTIMVSITMSVEKLQEFEKEGIKKTFSKTETNRKAILESIKELIGE